MLSLRNTIKSKLPFYQKRFQASILSSWWIIPLGWLCLSAVLLALVFSFFNGTLSILLPMSSLICLFSWVLIAHKVFIQKSFSGISMNMMFGHTLIGFSRVMSISHKDSGYLPLDGTGEGFYQYVEAASFAICLTIALYGFFLSDGTYKRSADQLNIWFLILPAFVCAIVMHSDMNESYILDSMWAFSLYLEVLVILPQLCYCQYEQKIESSLTHFLAAQTFAKMVSLVFWCFAYPVLNVADGPWYHRCVGNFVLVAQVLQIIIGADFMYNYMRCQIGGKPMRMLSSDCLV
eukprot:Platyproteum_vivax@DN14012_c0_g1_i2.p1